MENLDKKTEENIEKARSLRGLTPYEYLVPFGNIGDCLVNATRKFPQKPFLIYCDDDAKIRREYAYNEFLASARRIAHYLNKGLGLKRGDRVATIMHNHSDTVLIYFASWLLGAVVAPVNTGEDDERIFFTMENSETKAVFVFEEYIERALPILDRLSLLKHRIQVGGKTRAGFTSYEEAVAGADPNFVPTDIPSLEDEALIVYTSGTTGPPKGVLLTQYNLLADAYGISKWHGFTDKDRLMCVLPIHHVNGTIVTLLTPLYAQGSIVLNRKFKSDSFWKRVAEERVNCVSVVPTLFEYLCEKNEDIFQYDLKHFRHFICGAGPLTVELAMKFEERFGFPIVHGYGLSETTCYSCFLPPDISDSQRKHWLKDFGFPSIGIEIEPNEMAIHNAEGKPVPDGERGEIVIRGHNVMKCYFKRPDANADTFKYGWFRSGDEGFVKRGEDGRAYFFITGRIKELIIRGGINISPFEVDEVLRAIKGVRAAVAVGFDHKYYGEEVGAYVQLEEGAKLTEEDIMRECRTQLSFTKSPKVVIFGDDIPVTSTGKYQRNRLKHLFEAHKATKFKEK